MIESKTDGQEQLQTYKYRFSVVMAVYCAETFLKEAIESIIKQSIGFKNNIQLILVDDGSPDNSGKICDQYKQKYQENIIVIHKENGGVASARNEGLKYAEGEFINFMDSDDKMDITAFEKVYQFYQKHKEETDVVTIPVYFFDELEGPHWQNFKFENGDRVIDLLRDYASPIVFVNASFFVRESLEGILYDSRLVVAEDIKYLLEVLINKMTIGLVTNCNYWYRKRNTGNTSLVQGSQKKKEWYFDYFTYLIDWAVEFYQKKVNYLPLFVQYTLVGDLQWRFLNKINYNLVLSLEEQIAYKELLLKKLDYFEDNIIIQQRKLYREHKYYILKNRYHTEAKIKERKNNHTVYINNNVIGNLEDDFTRIDFISLKKNAISIEGYIRVPDIDIIRNGQIYLIVNEEKYPCERIDRKNIDSTFMEEILYRGIAFSCEVPLSSSIEFYRFSLFYQYNDIIIQKIKLDFGRFCPITLTYKNSYFSTKEWILTVDEQNLYIRKKRWGSKFKKECFYLMELLKKHSKASLHGLVGLLLSHFLHLFYHKKMYIISDRINKADDNGEAFFRYMIANKKKEVKCYFAISKNSSDYARLKKYGKVIPFLGWKYKMLYLLGADIISSQGEEYIFRPFYEHTEIYNNIAAKTRFIFLQHGVIKDDLSEWLNKYNKNLQMFVTTTKQEYKSILNGPYYYTDRVVKMTGLPRHDLLYHKEQKKITIMPTWRAYLVSDTDPQTGLRTLNSNFKTSAYYKLYQELLDNIPFLDMAEKYGYTIQFMNHPNMNAATKVFHIEKRLKVLPLQTSYREIFAESNMIITDYSSVAFDFAYLRKPVLYFQGDKEEFFSGGHMYEKGYFDYERDGFGEVEYTSSNLIKKIEEYIINDCRLKKKYEDRINETFPYNDNKNCERVYEEISNLY